MGVREKIANAKSTSWLTENMTEEEIQEIVTKAKEEAREQINKIESEDKE
jgi:phosphoribosyl-ATP pyrophosphohydrolase